MTDSLTGKSLWLTWMRPCWGQWEIQMVVESSINDLSLEYTLLEKSATWNPFCPVFRTLGKKGSQKGSLHVQEPKKVPYITKNYSKEPKKVLKTHLEPFREPLNVPPVGEPKNPFFLRVYRRINGA